MVKFVYNNAKNAITGYISFKLNFGYHPRVFYKKNVDLRSKSKSVDGLLNKLKEIINMYWENL